MRFVLALALAFAAASAHAEVRARIAATDPPAEATLGRDQQFFVRIQFDADEPVGLWTHAYFGGKRIEKGWKSNASAKWSGSGYALGWISFDKPVEVDEIRIVAGGGKPYREREVASYPVKLRWGEGPAAAASAPWVPELQRATAAAWEAERRAEAAKPPSAGDLMLGLVIPPALVALVLACLGAPVWALWKWRGWWRLAGVAAVRGDGVRRRADRRRHLARSDLAQPLAARDHLSGAAGARLILVLALARRFTGVGAHPS